MLSKILRKHIDSIEAGINRLGPTEVPSGPPEDKGEKPVFTPILKIHGSADGSAGRFFFSQMTVFRVYFDILQGYEQYGRFYML